jgi:hypothetical protein
MLRESVRDGQHVKSSSITSKLARRTKHLRARGIELKRQWDWVLLRFKVLPDLPVQSASPGVENIRTLPRPSQF